MTGNNSHTTTNKMNAINNPCTIWIANLTTLIVALALLVVARAARAVIIVIVVIVVIAVTIVIVGAVVLAVLVVLAGGAVVLVAGAATLYSFLSLRLSLLLWFQFMSLCYLVVIVANAVDAGVPSIMITTATLKRQRQRRQLAIKPKTTTRKAPPTTQLARKMIKPTIHVHFASSTSPL